MSKMNENNQLRLKADPFAGGWLSISEAAKYLRVSKDTLRRWEKEKIIKAYRSPTNRRYYRKEELEYVFSRKPDLEEKPIKPEKEKKIPQDRHSLVIITLLTLYIVLMIFLAWLLLQSSS